MTYQDLLFDDNLHDNPTQPPMNTSIGFDRTVISKWNEPNIAGFGVPTLDASTNVGKPGTIKINPPVVPNAEQSGIEDIVIVPIRDLSYEEAKTEIGQYIQNAGNRKVYISELAEELSIDIDLIIDILTELETS